MKTNKKDFEIFRKEVRRLIDLWELNNWSVRFEYIDLDRNEAQMQRDANCFNATFALNTTLQHGSFKEEQSRIDYIKMLAKHEVIHLLIGKFSFCGEARWCTDTEFNAAEEELVRKLLKII